MLHCIKFDQLEVNTAAIPAIREVITFGMLPRTREPPRADGATMADLSDRVEQEADGNEARHSRTRSSGRAVAFSVGTASAQKQGGILKIGHLDSPASMSLLEESTVAVNRPMMGVFNNLVMFDQHIPQNSLRSIVPDLATGWAWNEQGTELTLPLRQGVKWHDGKPFTAKDVKCTWDLLAGKSSEKLRLNPGKSWHEHLAEVTANGDYSTSSPPNPIEGSANS
jgi:ABC-type transport system substrate-binding protein